MGPHSKFRKKSYVALIFLFSLFWTLNIYGVSYTSACS